MGQFASRIHSKEDGKIYNILPMGDMPTVVFGRVIKEHSVPGMQYYFSDGRVKFQDGDKNKRDNMSNGGGWDAVIPFTKPKVFSAIKFDNGDGGSWIYRRYERGDKGKFKRAWAYVHGADDKNISDSTIDWNNVDYGDIIFTSDKNPSVGSYDKSGDYEVLEFSALSSDNINSQLPVIFTVPESFDYTKINDVEYVRQFCRMAIGLNANTMSSNFIIRNSKIICVKNVNFGDNKILSMEDRKMLNRDVYKSRFYYKYLLRNARSRILSRHINLYKMYIRDFMAHCIHNEFSIIPSVKRNKNKIYLSINEYEAYRYGCGRNKSDSRFNNWKWKLK